MTGETFYTIEASPLSAPEPLQVVSIVTKWSISPSGAFRWTTFRNVVGYADTMKRAHEMIDMARHGDGET